MISFRTLRRLVKSLSFIIEKDRMLSILERRLIDKDDIDLDSIRPVFLIGAPRSGSTLLYELLTTCFETSYISNLAALFFKSPALMSRITQSIRRPHRFAGRSTYGYISGVMAPAEAGPVFNHWFGESLDVNQLNVDINIPRHTVHAISRYMKGPFINKNLSNSMRIEILHRVFPRAVWIHVRRDPLYTAQSIIIARRKLFGSDKEWFSVKAPNLKEVPEMPPFKQVCFQIKDIEDRIEKDKFAYSLDNFLEARYEDLIHDYTEQLEHIASKCSLYEVPLTSRDTPDIRIDAKDERRLNRSEWDSLTQIVREVFE